jgi:hypothetical protein
MPGDIATLRGLRAALGSVGFFVLVVVLVLLWLLILRILRGRPGRLPTLVARVVTVAGVWVALAGIAELTLFGAQGLGADPRLELDPIAGAWGWSGIAWRPVLDNVTLFVPLGAGLSAWAVKRHPALLLALALLVSVGVETFQWAVPSGRIANSADVLANTVGAALGLVLAHLSGVRRGHAQQSSR